jgi:hemolysin III
MKLLDNRLFKEELLYCEGKHKPFLRGKIHLASLVFFPVGFYFVYHSKHPIMGSVNILSNMGCFGISGIYHSFNWSPSTEIVLQKLDHFAISLWCLFMMTPIAFILFPIEIRMPFITIIVSSFFINSHAIWHSRPSIIKSSAIPGSLLLFLPACYYYMNDYEWKCMWLSYAFQGAGTMAYVKNQQMKHSFTIFGYHELFHILTLFAAFHIYMLNYNIINRSLIN